MPEPRLATGFVDRIAWAIASDDYPEMRSWEDFSDWEIINYRRRAMAALKSMLDPTEQQIAAAWTHLAAAKKAAGVSRLGPGPGCREVWRTMIKAALEAENERP